MRCLLALLVLVACREPLCADCDPAAEYCVIYGSDVASVPSTSECVPYPTACAANPSCACLEGEIGEDSCILTDQCTTDDEGLVTETCPGG